MKVIHITVEEERLSSGRLLEADEKAQQLADSLSAKNPGMNIVVSKSHGSGPAVVICDLDDKKDPKTVFSGLSWKEYKENAQSQQGSGDGTGETSGGAGYSGGTDGNQATS